MKHFINSINTKKMENQLAKEQKKNEENKFLWINVKNLDQIAIKQIYLVLLFQHVKKLQLQRKNAKLIQMETVLTMRQILNMKLAAFIMKIMKTYVNQ